MKSLRCTVKTDTGGWSERRSERVLADPPPMVLVVGGGLVAEEETFNLLLAKCYTVWLKAQPEEHMARVLAQGDFRPMAGHEEAMQDLKRILDSRVPLYRKADAIVDTSGDTLAGSLAEAARDSARLTAQCPTFSPRHETFSAMSSAIRLSAARRRRSSSTSWPAATRWC